MNFKRISKTIILVTFLTLNNTAAFAKDEGGLINQMSRMQYFLHKTGLSLDAGNLELARFYAHELEEAIERLEKFGQYKNYSIGDLAKSNLSPGIKILEDSVKAGDLKKAWPAYEALAGRCNNCHQATDHGYIVIKYNKDTPYMQTFTPLH